MSVVHLELTFKLDLFCLKSRNLQTIVAFGTDNKCSKSKVSKGNPLRLSRATICHSKYCVLHFLSFQLSTVFSCIVTLRIFDTSTALQLRAANFNRRSYNWQKNKSITHRLFTPRNKRASTQITHFFKQNNAWPQFGISSH